MIYVDTNIFIDRSDRKSPNHNEARLFLDHVLTNDIKITTSTETIQELVYFGQKKKRLNLIINICELIMAQITPLIAIDETIVKVYLGFVKTYPTADSRDLIHLSACASNNIHIIITFDKDFAKFKEIRALTPQEYLQQV